MKKAIALILAVIMIVGMSAMASARWTYVASVGNTLSFSGSTANCSFDIQCYSTYTIKIHSVLEKKGSFLFVTWWDEIASVDRSYTNYSVYDHFTQSGLSGGTYRLVTTFTIYSGSTKLEEIERVSSEMKL